MNIVTDFASIQTISGPLIGGVATYAYNKCVVNMNPDTLLEACRQDLEEVKARLNEIPPERRDKIRAAALRGECRSLEELEGDLLASVPSPNAYVDIFERFCTFSLSDDRCDISFRSGNSSTWERYVPLTQLRDDIGTLKTSIQRLRMDTYVCDSSCRPV
jgi:hypothetical protein